MSERSHSIQFLDRLILRLNVAINTLLQVLTTDLRNTKFSQTKATYPTYASTNSAPNASGASFIEAARLHFSIAEA